jgi:hypothetical protein
MARREPFPHDDLVEEMARTFRDVQRTLAAQIQSAIAQGRLEFAAERRMQYAAVLATLDRLGAQTDQQAAKVVSDAFKEGAGKTGAQISQQAGFAVSVPYSFTGVQQDAIEALQREVVDSLGISRRVVGRSVDDLYAKAGRRATVRALLGADGSPQIAARRLKADLLREPYVKRLIEKGGTGFVDRAGKKWSLQSYSEMVVRTTTRKAVVEGQIAKMASLGVNLARISSHASSCPICVPFQGRLVSLDGAISDYNGEAVADLSSVGAPPYHPNCRHTLQPVVADIEALRREMQGSPPSQPVTISKPNLPKPTPATTSVARAADRPGQVPNFPKGAKGRVEAEQWANDQLLTPEADRSPHWAKKYAAEDLKSGKAPSPTIFASAPTDAIQSFLQGLTDILTPHNLRIDSLLVRRLPGRTPARFTQEGGGFGEGIVGPGSLRIAPGTLKDAAKTRKLAQEARDLFEIRRAKNIENLRLWEAHWKRQMEIEPENSKAYRHARAELGKIPKKIRAEEIAPRTSVWHTADDPLRSLARHEAGHALMMQTERMQQYWSDLVRYIDVEDQWRVSIYAASSTEELWAEVVAAVAEGYKVPKSLLDAYEQTMRRFGYAV